MKKLIANLLIICMLVTGIMAMLPGGKAASAYGQSGEQLRGVWISVFDLSPLGLKTSSEDTFRNKAATFLAEAGKNGVNTVFFHVRAFDDAVYLSDTFNRSTYVSSTTSYDPLKVITEEAHKQNMELHAWMNPYRINYDYYLDPALSQSTERILTAVDEVMAYGVDGIHFDDYFYHAKVGYKDTNGKVTIKKSQEPTAAVKRKNVNIMVKAVYDAVKAKDKNVDFGISPQGNMDNCQAAGADVKAWMSEDGYIDYIMPQIYWTDQYGKSGTTKMFSNRLKLWKETNQIDLPMHVGLALYRTNISYSDDPGWKEKSTNLKEQVQLLRDSGYRGYVLFSGQDLFRQGAAEELKNLREYLNSVEPSPSAPEIPSLNVEQNTWSSLNLSWNKVADATGYQIYRALEENGPYEKVKTSAVSITTYTNAELDPEQTYYYKIRAYKKVEGTNYYSKFSSIVSGTPRLEVPQASLSYVGYNSLNVKWNEIEGADGYKIYQASASKGPYTAVKTIKFPSTLEYKVTGLTTGQMYYYKIRGYTTVSGKTQYGRVCAPIAKAPRPAAPTVTATASNKNAVLSWNKISGAQGYRIYRTLSSEGEYKAIKTLTSGTQVKYSDQKLEPGTYGYKVRAFRKEANKNFYSGYSTVKLVDIQ